MVIYDISVSIHNDMHVWPSDPKVRLEQQRHQSRDGSHAIRVTSIQCGNHTGTHLDAPSHMLDGGTTLSDIPLDRLVGPSQVVDIPGVATVGRTNLENRIRDGLERVLLKTDNSRHWSDSDFYEDFTGLTPDGAEYLVELGVRLVGIDYLSIERYGSLDHATHFVLLRESVVILEGLNLEDVPAGEYQLVALPLKLDRADGAPLRAILLG
jgi:arylformamidase